MSRLSAKAIVNFQSVNSFNNAIQWIVRAGDTSILYFQLIDLDQVVGGSSGSAYGLPISSLGQIGGLRYIAGIGITPTLQVTFPSIDANKTIVKSATQNANDGSIWSISLASTDIPSGGNVIFSLVEGGTTRSFGVLNLLAVEYPGADGSDGSIPNVGC